MFEMKSPDAFSSNKKIKQQTENTSFNLQITNDSNYRNDYLVRHLLKFKPLIASSEWKTNDLM